MSGHEKGILSLSWCKQDADLLLSCGKDSRTIVWNPQSGEAIGEVINFPLSYYNTSDLLFNKLPAASNWAYQVEWCPRDPNILATASFDGSIGIHSLQSTNQEGATKAPANATDDVFAPSYHQNYETTLSLKQPPKWLKRPVGGAFAYGGTFVSFTNLAGATGQHQSGSVHMHHIATEKSITKRANDLAEAAKETSTLSSFATKKAADSASNAEDEASWKALSSLFNTGSRDELITLLGFSKENIAERVAAAIKKLQGTPTASAKPLPAAEEASSEDAKTPSEKTPSEQEIVIKTEPEEPSLSEPTSSASSLFGDVAGTPQADAEADFFSSMGPIPAVPRHMQIPHVDPRGESSAAATQGSRSPSVAASEVNRSNTFRIYPEDESEVDQLVTQALVLGDFASAVELCLSTDRFADAILLAIKGGSDLLKKTQTAYFERTVSTQPYLRLYQSVVGNDLMDIVQNADLREWQEVFVILCTYATQEEFSTLTEQLGLRLEFQGTLVKTAGADDAESKARLLRKNATLCYLAAGNLEKLLNIWLEEMVEEQETYGSNIESAPKDASLYTAHAQSLQTFIEKVTVFRSAVKYRDIELENPTSSNAVAESGARTYKLASLYDRYVEYADLLAAQGLLDLAVTYVLLTPKDYNSGEGTKSPFYFGKERLLVAAGKETGTTTTSAAPAVPSKPAATPAAKPSAPRGVPPYGAPSYPAVTPAAPSAYPTYGGPPNNSYGGSYGMIQPIYGQSPYGQSGPPPSMIPAPPPAVNTGYTPPTSTAPTPSTTVPPPVPAALRRDIPGWNDPPNAPARRTPVPAASAAAITNPLPNTSPVQNPYGQPHPAGPASIPPPPRAGSANIPPPPRANAVPPPPKAGAPPSTLGVAPPSLVTSQSQPSYGSRPGSAANYEIRPPSTGPSRYAPPPRTDSAGLNEPPRTNMAPPPPKQGHFAPPPPPMARSPYAPPPGSGGDASVSSPGSNVPPPPRAGGPPIVRSAPSASSPYAPSPSSQPPPSAATSQPPPPPAAAAPPPKPVAPKYREFITRIGICVQF